MSFKNLFSVNNEGVTKKHFAEPTSLDVSWGKELRLQHGGDQEFHCSNNFEG